MPDWVIFAAAFALPPVPPPPVTVRSNWLMMKREFKAVPLVGPTAVIFTLARSGTEIENGVVLNEPLLVAVMPSKMAYCFSVVPMERVPMPEIRSDCPTARPVTLLKVKTSDSSSSAMRLFRLSISTALPPETPMPSL